MGTRARNKNGNREETEGDGEIMSHGNGNGQYLNALMELKTITSNIIAICALSVDEVATLSYFDYLSDQKGSKIVNSKSNNNNTSSNSSSQEHSMEEEGSTEEQQADKFIILVLHENGQLATWKHTSPLSSFHNEPDTDADTDTEATGRGTRKRIKNTNKKLGYQPVKRVYAKQEQGQGSSGQLVATLDCFNPPRNAIKLMERGETRLSPFTLSRSSSIKVVD